MYLPFFTQILHVKMFLKFLVKNKSTQVLNEVIGNSLIKNSKELDLWVFAAYNELDNNLNIHNARELFQKCIRINSSNVFAHLK